MQGPADVIMAAAPPSPWLRIPAEDYEGHMRTVGQSAALRALFREVYAEQRPARVAVLGCSTGGDLEQLDDVATRTAIGVDVNPDYLAVAAQRLGPRVGAPGSRVRLIPGDVLQVELPEASFDLIHAALLLEYIDPSALFARISRWLSATGTCSVITQEPRDDLSAVSDAGYASLNILDGHMVVRPATDIAALAAKEGLRLVARRALFLASGKTLVGSRFERASV